MTVDDMNPYDEENYWFDYAYKIPTKLDYISYYIEYMYIYIWRMLINIGILPLVRKIKFNHRNATRISRNGDLINHLYMPSSYEYVLPKYPSYPRKHSL